jgi:hypothetical protein
MKSANASLPVSDPSKVMQMIHAAGTDLTALTASPTPHWHRFRNGSDVPSHLKLHVEPEGETEECWSEAQPVSARQISQLVEHLRQRQHDLDQREADLQANVYCWEQQVAAHQSQLRKRSLELEQHLTQVRAQQDQLIKLQESLVNSQSAQRALIEQMVTSSEPGQLKTVLEKLQFELTEGMNAILHRWERLKMQP